MRIRPHLLAISLTTALLVLGLALADEKDPPTPAQGLAAFETVHKVFLHPRCMNCHPTGDRPLQGDDGLPHTMNVKRGDDDHGKPGLRCASCHGKQNGPEAGMPPGAPGWHLAPARMATEGLTPRQLAQHLRDPKRTQLTPETLLRHSARDPLVRWGWAPGPGREPVSVPHKEFIEALSTWIQAGMPVPPKSK